MTEPERINLAWIRRCPHLVNAREALALVDAVEAAQDVQHDTAERPLSERLRALDAALAPFTPKTA